MEVRRSSNLPGSPWEEWLWTRLEITTFVFYPSPRSSFASVMVSFDRDGGVALRGSSGAHLKGVSGFNGSYVMGNLSLDPLKFAVFNKMILEHPRVT